MDTHNTDKPALQVVDYQPLAGAVREQRGPIAGRVWLLGFVVLSCVAIMLYLVIARPVILNLSPEDSQVDLNGLSFNIGSNYLLLPGNYQAKITAPGYLDLQRDITVSDKVGQKVDLMLQPLPGELLITSSLEPLTALLDGKALTTQLPGLITGIDRGKHQLTVTKPRYFDGEFALDIVGLGKRQTLDVALTPAWGMLGITTAPPGAAVIIDDQPVGTTPLKAEILSTGSRVELRKDGFRTWLGTLSTPAGSDSDHPPIALMIADGYVNVDSQPRGASVTVNGDFQGLTPVDIAVRPNRAHRIDFFLTGYLKHQREITAKPEQQLALKVKLKEDIGEIVLNIVPNDALIFIDGQRIGQGSQTLRLPSKEQRLEVRRDGYQTAARSLLPKPGQQQALSLSLITKEDAYWARRPAKITAFGDIELALMRPTQPFQMGAPRREPGRRSNEVERAVVLKRPFYLGTKEITNRQFRLWRNEHSSSAFQGNTLDMQDQPVANVSWEEAARFCNWLSQRDQLTPFYGVEDGRIATNNWRANGYRLPTEAEWAWAAKIKPNNSSVMYAWDNNRYPPDTVVANYADASAMSVVRFSLPSYKDNYPVSAVVGTFKPNARGLYNMSGNVAEWVNDYYDLQPHSAAPLEDPRGPQFGVRKVVRGASWRLGSRSELRLSYRDNSEAKRLDLGFRIARYVDPLEGTL